MLVPIQMGNITAAGNQEKHLSLSFATKAWIYLSWNSKTLQFFSNTRTVQLAKFPEINHFSNQQDNSLGRVWKRRATQTLRNSSVVYHQTKNLFGAKIGVDICFQLLLCIMKLKSQEDHSYVVWMLLTSCDNRQFGFQDFAISSCDSPLFPDFVVDRRPSWWRSNFFIQDEKYECGFLYSIH